MTAPKLLSTRSHALSSPDAEGRRRTGLAGVARLAIRAAQDGRFRTIGFACLFALVPYLASVAYRDAYKTVASRLTFARNFGTNKAIVLFYGHAYTVLTVGGYAAWRAGGTLAIFAAVYGLLAAVRALRAEEDTGRAEIVLAGRVSRRASYLAAITAIGLSAAALWLAEFAGLALSGLAAGGSAYLALGTSSVVVVFVGAGALVSQLASSRRVALEIGVGLVSLALVLRVVADTVNGATWLRWSTPLGWAELLRPFAGPQPLILVLPTITSAALLFVAQQIAQRRDIGTGVIQTRDAKPPRYDLLSSVTAQCLRLERGTLIVWVGGTAVFAGVCGAIAKATQSAGLSKSLQHELGKVGSGSITTPAGYLGLTFIFFVLVVALFAIAQVAAARREESDERLETVLALPVSRPQWLAGRLLLAFAAAACISFASALTAWLAAQAGGARVPLIGMIEAGANCLVIGTFFLGVTAVLYALAPRVSTGTAYALAMIAFLWQLLGSLLDVPAWTLKLTPFAHIGLAPGSPFRPLAAVVLAGIGVATALTGLFAFARRDLTAA